jgi:hypothetical protein
MPVSQLKVFSFADANAPALTGTTGSLVALLDAVLVSGYGTKAGLGWLKPLANDSLTSSLACWKQPSGSGLILYMNDAAPSGSTNFGGNEAWVCGYESIVGLTGSTYPTTGTGYGSFPHVSQVFVSLVNGTVPSASLWWRKSTTTGNIPRPWFLFGDAHTFYLFVQVGDTAGVYYTYWFGDLFSLKNGTDSFKCIVKGRVANQNNASTYRFDAGDLILKPTSTGYPHFFAARSIGGGGISCALNVIGDQGKNTLQSLSRPDGAAETSCEMAGIIPFPNPTDGSIYLTPLLVTEQSTGTIRGRLRGLYHMSHATTYFADGQQIQGANEYAGKTFQCIKTGPFSVVNGSVWLVEISPTVETNG